MCEKERNERLSNAIQSEWGQPRMNKDRANNTDLPEPTRKAFDAFTGFIYATTFSLVIKAAYTESKLNSAGPVALTSIILAFLVVDGVIRYIGRHSISKDTTSRPRRITLFSIELIVVYFLLLVFLNCIYIYAHPNSVQITWTGHRAGWTLDWTHFRWGQTFIDMPSGRMFCYLTATFAIFSGGWNAVMIWFSHQVNWRHVCMLLKGHLDDEILKMFPFNRVWQNRLEKQLEPYKEAHRRHTEAASSPKDKAGEIYQTYLSIVGAIYRFPILLKCIAKNPVYLIVPYLLAAHIVALNFLLGLFILLSAGLLGGESVFSVQPFLSAGWLALLVLLLLLFVGALVFLGMHFASRRSCILYERLGWICLAIAILLLYSVCTAIILVLLVFCQQFVANILMGIFFRPQAGTADPVPQEREELEQGAGT